MRKLRILAHISLDGVIQHDGEGGFQYGDWTGPFRSPEGLAAVLEAQGGTFDLILGRRTYDAWSKYWPNAGNGAMANLLNAATKFVATHRPDSLAWGPAADLGTDPVESIRNLKSADGPDLNIWGSSTLTTALLGAGLADEVVLMIYPVLLGHGKRFFSDTATPRHLALTGTKTTSTGVVVNTYRYVGALNL